jgi:poly(A) polymerase
MPTRLASDSTHRQFAENIVRQIVEQHHIAYFAGGCVRDDLLGIPPSDYDIATSATPEQVRAIFGPHRTLMVGAAFGVICVHERIRGELFQVEVATFRSDGKYSDGRRPDRVDYTTPEFDAQRRDFTINGLFFDPLTNRVIDYVGGQEDLKRRLLRAIGNPHARFSEDKLRLLRAVRIAARFQLDIDCDTRSAIIGMANEIQLVSPERIAAEMRKMLEHPYRATAVRLLNEFQLLMPVFPDFARPLTNPTVLQSTLAQLEAISYPDFVASLAILSYASIGEAEADQRRSIARSLVEKLKIRWRLSNDDAAALEFILINTQVLLNANQAKWSILQPLLVSPSTQSALHFASVILRTTQGNDQLLDRCRKALELTPSELDPAPLVDGHLLMSMGLPTGPLYARLIKLGRAAQLDGELKTQADAIEWVRKQMQP